MSRKNRNKKSWVFFEILQNGEFVSRTRKKFGSKSSIRITSSSKGDLPVPFYPLIQDIEIAKIDKNGVHLNLDQSWEGFATFNGKLINIASQKRNLHQYTLKDGDYCSINRRDLKVLIKICPDPDSTNRQLKGPNIYRGKLLDLWIGKASDFYALTASFILSAWIFGFFCWGLWNRPNDIPQRFIDLEPKYTIPFVFHQHISNAPETLQFNLDRKRPLASIIDYYQHYVSMLIGKPLPNSTLLFRSSKDIYNKMYYDQNAEIRKKQRTQKDAEEKQLGQIGNAIVAIPTILGETFPSQIIRLFDKISINHNSLEETLNYRRESTKEFNGEPTYEYGNYKSFNKKPKKDPKISKVLVWIPKDDEAMMYKSANSLAKSAQRERYRINKYKEKRIGLSVENTSPISIAAKSDFASWINPGDLSRLNEKLSQIHASEYGVSFKKKAKEPLLGEVESHLVDRAIKTNRFELQLCYELALRRDQLTGGTMKWRWRLDTRGKVSDITLVKSSINDTRMINCIKKKIRKWDFPRTRRGSVQITYPFHFAPINDKG